MNTDMPSGRIRVLLGVVQCAEDLPAVSVRDVALNCGMTVSTVHHHLVRLRVDGYVTWTDGVASTLHPLVKEVA